MPVDAYVSLPNYLAHVLPVWYGLPPEHRGTFWVAGWVGNEPPPERIPGWRVGYPPPGANPVLVAGYQDEVDASRRRRTIYLEHGAGQTYNGCPEGRDHEAYSGSPGHGRTVLFLCPSETVADRWRARYPGVPAVAVGCPKLDLWHVQPPRPSVRLRPALTVAFTWHSDNRLCAESGTAWPHYQPAMQQVANQLRAEGLDVVGHAHPRMWSRVERTLRIMGITTIENLDEVFKRADVLVADNTSAAVEFASLGRPIVWCNSPEYRRDVHHGGRFWDWTEDQPVVDEPEDLGDRILEACEDRPEWRTGRQRMVDSAYCATDGKATQRAVQAILDVAG